MHSRLTLERELRDLLGTGRKARIAARYYGFDGRGGGTLQNVGNEIGVTRERVRQIVSAASESLSTRRADSPTLDRTIAFVADRMPAAAGEIEAELQFQRLTSRLFRLEGVIKAAELLAAEVSHSAFEDYFGRNLGLIARVLDYAISRSRPRTSNTSHFEDKERSHIGNVGLPKES